MNKVKYKELPNIEITEELLNEITQRVVEYFQPMKVIFFGSHIWGNPGRNSDIDLLVIMQSKSRPALRASLIRRMCRPKFVPMDVLVRTPQEIKKRLEMKDHFIKRILEKGKVFYERKT